MSENEIIEQVMHDL